MKVISTNLGQKRTKIYKGKQIETGIYKFPVLQSLKLELNDVNDDIVVDRKYHGGRDKACYLYSTDHYKFWKQLYPELNWQWGMFGENISIQGLDESKIYIGDIFRLGSALVQITQPRQPCFKLSIRLENNNAVSKFIQLEKPGAYVRILKMGKVATGDTFELIERKQTSFSLKQVFHYIYHASENISAIKRVIKLPELATSCRDDLIKYGRL